MSWDRKRRGSASGYYYRSVRTPDGSVKKIYLGRGAAAKYTAAAVELRRRLQAKEQARLSQETEATAEAEQLADELRTWAHVLFGSWMITAGHQKHRGQWRLSMNKPMPTDETAKGSSKRQPKVGSRAWEQAVWDNPTYLKNTLPRLVERAAKGNKQAAETLEWLLSRHPHLRRQVRQLDDLLTQAETAWVNAASFGDEVAAKAAQEEAERLKAELLGAAPTIVDRIMVGAVVVSYLAHQRAVIVASRGAETPAIAAMRDRRAESAQRRLNAAIKAFELFRSKKSKGISPPIGETTLRWAGISTYTRGNQLSSYFPSPEWGNFPTTRRLTSWIAVLALLTTSTTSSGNRG